MRKLMLVGAAACSLLLTSCNEIDDATLQNIQNEAVKQCSFLPTYVEIAGVFPQYSSEVATASTVASLLCAVVKAQVPKSVRLRTGRFWRTEQAALTPVKVSVTLPNGSVMTVTGTFVRSARRR